MSFLANNCGYQTCRPLIAKQGNTCPPRKWWIYLLNHMHKKAKTLEFFDCCRKTANYAERSLVDSVCLLLVFKSWDIKNLNHFHVAWLPKRCLRSALTKSNIKNVQNVRVRQTNRPYVHSKDVFRYRRFVNRIEALPWFFLLTYWKIWIWKLTDSCLPVFGCVLQLFHTFIKKVSLRTPVKFSIFSGYKQ